MDKLSAKLETTGRSISAKLNSDPSNAIIVRLNTNAQIKKLKQIRVTPTSQTQVFRPDGGYDGFSAVTVNAIPPNYGKITYDGVKILVE